MKILISDDQAGAHSYLRVALARAFQALGHECRVWHIKKKPAADVFDEYNPDIFLSQSYNLTDHICRLIEERPHLKVGLRVPDYSDLADEVSKKYPILTARPEEFTRVCRLRDRTGQPLFVHCHYPQSYMNRTHERWIKAGFKTVGLLNFADPWFYSGGRYFEEFSSDICFIGFRSSYKSRTLDPYLGQFFSPIGAYRVKVFGNGWGSHAACGYAPEHICRDLLASATICPNIHEPHSELGWDIVQRTFNNLSNKCFVISDFVHGLASLLPQGLEFASYPEEFKVKVDYYLANPDKRLPFIERGYQMVRDAHTSLDRAEQVFEWLNIPVLSQKERVKKEIGLI